MSKYSRETIIRFIRNRNPRIDATMTARTDNGISKKYLIFYYKKNTTMFNRKIKVGSNLATNNKIYLLQTSVLRCSTNSSAY